MLASLHPSPTLCSQVTASGFILFIYFKVKYHRVTPAASHFSQKKTLQCLQAPADMALLRPPPRVSHCGSSCFLLPRWAPQRWCPGPSSNQARKLPSEGFHSSCVRCRESASSREPRGSSPHFLLTFLSYSRRPTQTTFNTAHGLLPCMEPLNPRTFSTCLYSTALSPSNKPDYVPIYCQLVTNRIKHMIKYTTAITNIGVPPHPTTILIDVFRRTFGIE